jgi:hypothetical protein
LLVDRIALALSVQSASGAFKPVADPRCAWRSS